MAQPSFWNIEKGKEECIAPSQIFGVLDKMSDNDKKIKTDFFKQDLSVSKNIHNNRMLGKVKPEFLVGIILALQTGYSLNRGCVLGKKIGQERS